MTSIDNEHRDSQTDPFLQRRHHCPGKMHHAIKDMSYLFGEFVRTCTAAAVILAFFSCPQLQPSTVWLRERYSGGMVFVPNDHGTSFDLPTEVDEIPAILVVEGTPLSDPPSPANHQQQVIPPPAPAVERQQAIAPFTCRKSQQQCNVKVERAEILGWSPAGKPDLHSLDQLFVTLKAASANVDHVVSAVQRKWGQDYILITANGLKVEDSSGTQGTAVNSVYAVN